MQHDSFRTAPAAPRNAAPRPARPARLGVLLAGLLAAGAVQAVDIGPFSVTGFVNGEIGSVSNACKPSCQADPTAGRDKQWADALAYGSHYGTVFTHGYKVQPYIGFKQDLGRGFTFSALWSQRYRDGNVDLVNTLYEKNVSLSHEDYGVLQLGKFPSRTWLFTDFPFAGDIGMSPFFSDSGAAYGLLTNAARYTSRIFDVAEGDLVAEVSYDRGDTDFKIHKPRLLEFWLHYGRGPLRLEAMVQDSRNGVPSAFSHGPFNGPYYDASADKLLGGSGQSVVMLLAKYQLDPRWELSGGLRRNRWSGAYAVQTANIGTRDAQWNDGFNVDWGGVDANGVSNPGYSARSTDFMAGVRYRVDQWTTHVGIGYLGKASTDNPSERGQSNSALVGSVGLKYDFPNRLNVYGSLNMVKYDHKGLAPLSMPSHSAFTNVDSRVADRGNWVTLGATYSF